MISHLESLIDGMVSRAIVRLVNDKTKMQSLQVKVMRGEGLDDVEHFQPCGLSFKPPKGSEAVLLSVAGSRENAIAICVSDRDARPTDLEDNEGGLYAPDGEWKFFIDKDGDVSIHSKGAEQPFVRGEDLVSALLDALDGVSAAIAKITSGPTTTGGAPAKLDIDTQVRPAFEQALQSALSKSIRGE